ncbi:hypothetical protein [Aeromonas hydrophila]|nr:hypothetical protein [Aeromonas hydrophila]
MLMLAGEVLSMSLNRSSFDWSIRLSTSTDFLVVRRDWLIELH